MLTGGAPSVIHNNSDMTPEQLRVAAQFVDQMLDIGAMGLAQAGDQLVTQAAPASVVGVPARALGPRSGREPSGLPIHPSIRHSRQLGHDSGTATRRRTVCG